MSESKKQTEFFKAVIESENSSDNERLKQRILQAEQDESCCRRAMVRVLLLAFVSFLGFGYSLVIVPEVVLEPGNLINKFCLVVSLGSFFSFLIFLGFWIYYHAVLRQVHQDCRKFIMKKVVLSSGKSGWEPLNPYAVKAA